MEESIKSLMDEIRGRLELLESSLPRCVDAAAVSLTAKMPFKALLCREALIWRMAELGRSAFESFENDKLASAILLTRAAVETSAVLWCLCAKIDAVMNSGAVDDIDDYLMKLTMGSKTNQNMPKSINVLTFVQHVDKDIVGFHDRYNALSEFAHPHWAGTALLYSKPDPANFRVDFGSNIRAGDSTRETGVLNLSVALMIFERSYNRITDLMPAFITLCESKLSR